MILTKGEKVVIMAKPSGVPNSVLNRIAYVKYVPNDGHIWAEKCYGIAFDDPNEHYGICDAWWFSQKEIDDGWVVPALKKVKIRKLQKQRQLCR